ncbi:MAG: hypothetical protein IKI99_01980 [Firmicutes bacterium]|nr:hypothetical protein [Bacillota bacterium]
MKKETLKWIVLIIVVLIAGVFVISRCGQSDGSLKAVSEDSRWEAYAMETTDGGEKAWRGVVVYKGENPEKIQNVRTQVCINGIRNKYTKRQLQEAGTLGVKKSDAGGEEEFYIFMKGRKERPASLSVKVKWKENGAVHVEKMWMVTKPK